MTYEHDSLTHYGIKGQSWGVRRFQNEDGSLTEAGKQRYGYYDKGDGTKDYKRIQKDAKNDAAEYARAKAYYGEGAGTRRKKIKNQISERMKDPDYKAAFNYHMKNQNMEEHQKAANRERKWEDTKNTVGKTARGVKNLLLGVGSASIAALSIYTMAKYTGISKKIGEWGKTAISKIGNLFKPKPKDSIDNYDWSKSQPKKEVGDEGIRNYWSHYNQAAINRDQNKPSSSGTVNNSSGRRLRYDKNGRPYWG